MFLTETTSGEARQRDHTQMDTRVEVEEAVQGRLGKKSKKSKKNETNELEEVTDCKVAAPMGLETSFKLGEEDKEKTNNKKLEVGGNTELDRIHDEAANGKSHAIVGSDLHKDKDRKQKKEKKRNLKFSHEVTSCTDVAATRVENNFKVSKENEKIKSKKKHKVGGENIVLDGTSDEVLHRDGYVEVNGGLQKEKDQKKAKKRKLKSHEGKNTSNDKSQMEGEEKRSLQIDDGMDAGTSSELIQIKDKKKRNVEQRKTDGSNPLFSSMEIHEVAKRNKSFEKEDINEIENGEEAPKGKKNKKVRGDNVDSIVEGKKKTKDGKEVGKSGEDYDGDVMERVGKKRRKREKKKDRDDLGDGLQEVTEEAGNERTESPTFEVKDFVESDGNVHSTTNKAQGSRTKNGDTGKRKKSKSVKNGAENFKPKGKSKKVSFSSHVEVFPPSEDPSTGNESPLKEDLVRGKRFSREEDVIIKGAVFDYIEAHGLGEEGLDMVLHCSSHPEIKNCWKEIGAAIPYRPCSAIYYRAHILFERDEKRKWTKEEYEVLRKFHAKHGNNWKLLADGLGKHRFHVKDTWRRIKLPNLKKGNWSQEEYQSLFDLVNKDLQMKAFEEKRSKHGMLRDNICWGAISDKLSTRANATCCKKWYTQLTSSMVAEGKWADADDYRLLDALFNLDACCVEDVDWVNLLSHRDGDVCRKRWDQMVLHIGHHGNKSFAEQVEILSKRYCPDLFEAREAWDSKPVVP